MGRRRKIAEPGDATKAIAYTRVSTGEQSLGLAAQKDAIERWCAAQREPVQIVAWLQDEGVSGGTPLEDRVGLQAAVQAVEEHGAGLLVLHRRDRLARDVVISAVTERHVQRLGGRVVAVQGGANGTGAEQELLRTLLDAFAAFERSTIKSRIRAALDVKRRRNERIGDIPLGFTLAKDKKTLVPDDQEQEVVQRILRLRGQGLSYPAIARDLEENGYEPRGKRWYPGTIRRIVIRS